MIVLRKVKNSDGSTSLLLDYRTTVIGNDGQLKRERKREYLKDLKLLKPKTPLDREENRKRLRMAEQIRNKREQQMASNEYEVTPDFNKQIDFVKFFEKFVSTYNKKDKRVVSACLSKFKDFMLLNKITSLLTKQVNEGLANDFKEYLESTMKGESPHNYFSKFKKMLKYGVREKVFVKSPADELSIKKNESSIEKDILTFEEINKLAGADCGNSEVKRAFLFSCLTGLRWCDIVALKWEHIQGEQLKMKQQKTNIPVNVNLNKDALQLLGEIGKREDFVFVLPSHTAALKNLRNWCNRAKVEKHITFHCARHSFGTNLIFFGADVNTVSKLLGHASLDFTQRYLREAQALKEKAVNNLPTINL